MSPTRYDASRDAMVHLTVHPDRLVCKYAVEGRSGYSGVAEVSADNLDMDDLQRVIRLADDGNPLVVLEALAHFHRNIAERVALLTAGVPSEWVDAYLTHEGAS